jgi:hypothetical protein
MAMAVDPSADAWCNALVVPIERYAALAPALLGSAPASSKRFTTVK